MEKTPKFVPVPTPPAVMHYLVFVKVEVVSLLSGNPQGQYTAREIYKLLTQWFEGTSREYTLFADPQGLEKLTWTSLTSNTKDLKIIYFVKIEPPIIGGDLLEKFPPILEMRDRKTGQIIRSHTPGDPYDPTILTLPIGPNQPHTVEVVNGALMNLSPGRWRGINPPTWQLYNLFEDMEGEIPIEWNQILANWGPDRIKTIYIEYNDPPANPRQWEDILYEYQQPEYLRNVFDYTLYFRGLGYELVDEARNLYDKIV